MLTSNSIIRHTQKRQAASLAPILLLLALFGAALFAGGYFFAKGQGPAIPGLSQPAPSAPVSAGDIHCYFSPEGGCTQAVVDAIHAAKQSIHVQAYSFTSRPIAQALLDAHRRGLKVLVILDKSQRTAHYSEADFLAHGGIPTWIDARHAIAHNKIMLIDSRTTITGSFNFTNAAEKNNAENLLVLSNVPAIYKAYEDNFQKHLAHSEPYGGR